MRRLHKINDIDSSFGDETVNFSVTRTARRCPRYPNASRGKSWAITYDLFLTVERPVMVVMPFSCGTQFGFVKSKGRPVLELLPQVLGQGQGKTNLLRIKARFQHEYNSLLNFDTGIQLSLTITNDLSLEMRVTARLSGVSTNRLSCSYA